MYSVSGPNCYFIQAGIETLLYPSLVFNPVCFVCVSPSVFPVVLLYYTRNSRCLMVSVGLKKI